MATADDPAIACRLDALTPEERERRATLAQELISQARSVKELSDGYEFQLPGTASLAHQALDWLLLERRCCEFFRLELELEPKQGPLWLRLRGGSGVKEFLSTAGILKHRDATEHVVR